MVELIENKYLREGHPPEIYAEPEMDRMRKEKCLCLNCRRGDEKIPYYSCPVAQSVYRICVDNDMAMMITRCGAIDKKGNLLYEPRN